MNNINIAIMQIKPLKSIQENLDKGIRNCIKAKEMGADIEICGKRLKIKVNYL